MPAARLTTADRDRIRRLRGVHSAAVCANTYGVSRSRIYEIWRNEDINGRPNRSGTRQMRRAAGRRLGLNRRFGVEMEFFGMTRATANEAIRAAGLTGWRVKSDCSVSGSGLELVSPPLSGDAGLDQVRRACAALNANGARVNQTCGLHVHHDASDLGATGVRRVARSYANNQRHIDWLVSESRRTAAGPTYCRPWAQDELDYMDQSANTRGYGERYVYAPTRYKTINVQSFSQHGTVEIRQHQGTTNFRKIEAWIRFGQKMMDDAAESNDSMVAAAGIRSLMENVDEDAAAYLMGRAISFGAPAELVAA